MDFALCFSLPGGTEWLIIILFGLLLIASPIAAIHYYSKSKSLKRENDSLKAERDKYLERLFEKV